MVISDDLGWSSYRWAATFVKKTPFTQAEIEEVQAAISGYPHMTIIYMPKVFAPGTQSEMERTEADRDPPTRFARSVYNRLLTSAPSERAAFINSYQFRIDPVFDDRPFFFEYYKPGALAADANARGADASLRTIRGPAGYYVLYILLGVCSVMSVGCILVPLWLFQRRGLKTPGVVPLLVFFACLGAGYMMFEIGAMQVLNVFVGDPAYSLALVLAGLLVASGIGAALSGKLSHLPAIRVISFATAIIGAAIVVWLTCTHILVPRAMQFPLSTRAALTLVGLLPVGILLGLPFPTAIKEVEKLNPKFIAWAWGVNGVTSVLASIIAIVVAMRIGFATVVWISAATYLLGMLSYGLHSYTLTRAGWK